MSPNSQCYVFSFLLACSLVPLTISQQRPRHLKFQNLKINKSNISRNLSNILNMLILFQCVKIFSPSRDFLNKSRFSQHSKLFQLIKTFSMCQNFFYMSTLFLQVQTFSTFETFSASQDFFNKSTLFQDVITFFICKTFSTSPDFFNKSKLFKYDETKITLFESIEMLIF
jgi:hypothetical protein